MTKRKKRLRPNRTRPPFTEDLLPGHIGVEYRYLNRGHGRRTITIARLYYVENGQPITEAHAICAPGDRYNRKLGETIATGRAVRVWWEHEQITNRIAENVRQAVPQHLSGSGVKLSFKSKAAGGP